MEFRVKYKKDYYGNYANIVQARTWWFPIFRDIHYEIEECDGNEYYQTAFASKERAEKWMEENQYATNIKFSLWLGWYF
jgi:hypothetical protein